VGFDAKVSLADGDEDRRLRDGVGAEVMQLRSVVLAQSPHEPADGDAEAPLVKTHEAHNVALGRLRLGLLRQRGDPRRCPEVVFTGNSRSATNCSRTATVAEDLPHGKGSWTSDISSSRGGGAGV